MAEILTKTIIVDKFQNTGVRVYRDENCSHTERYIVEYQSGGSWDKFTVPFHSMERISECLALAHKTLIIKPK